MVNTSFRQDTFPLSQKSAIVIPVLKKVTLDPIDLKSYRPISNLSLVSKLLEKVATTQFGSYASENNLLPACQSAYRRHHSTETAVIRVHNDILRATDSGFVSALVLLDLSAAFDTVDHEIFLNILHDRFGVQSSALDWYRSYLSDRSQTVRSSADAHGPIIISCGLPQGSIIGPGGFIAYTEELQELIAKFSLSFQFYADDIQLLSHMPVSAIPTYLPVIEHCFTSAHEWFRSRRLQLNADKTEFAWFGSKTNLEKTRSNGVRFGDANIQPVDTVKVLGVQLDGELNMRKQVSSIASACFFQLRRIRQLRHVIGPAALQRVVSALVLSRLDYCNAVLAGLPASTIAPLQRVQNAAARLVAGLGPRDHITSALKTLHWLPVVYRVRFKLCVLVHGVFYCYGPTYLADLFVPVAELPGRSRLRSAASLTLDVPRVRKSAGDRAFSVAGARAWNDLPLILRQISSPDTFKRHLKSHLFTIAFQ